MADLAAKFAEHEITPKIIPNPPKNKLDVGLLLSYFLLTKILHLFTVTAQLRRYSARAWSDAEHAQLALRSQMGLQRRPRGDLLPSHDR